MTALAEALLAAQRQAIGALSKAYIAGAFEDDGDAGLIANLDRIGATDAVDQAQLVHSLDVLRTYGAPAPATPRASDGPKMISDGQKPYIRDLFRKKNIEPLPDIDVNALTYAQASALIDSLKDGTYDPAEYVIPF